MSKKILVADDSVVIQKAIGITFAQEDFEVTFVGNGEEALQRAKEIHPDLILADTNMPKLSGSDLCRKLRMDSSFQKTPIILLANSKESFSPSQLEGFGANDFVQKPFESTQLLTKAKTLLEQARTASTAANAVQRDILADSSVMNEEPPSIRRSSPKSKPASMDIGASKEQPEYFQEKTSGEADLPLQMDSFSSIPTPGFMPNSDLGMDLLDHTDSTPQQSMIPEQEFNTKVIQKPTVPDYASPVSAPAEGPNLHLSEKQIEEIVARVFQNVIERIAWEVVPDLAERIIKDEIQKLTQES